MKKTCFLATLVLMLISLTAASADEVVIAGMFDNSIVSQYQAEHPETTVTECFDYFKNTGELMDAMVTGRTDFDIMVLWTGSEDAAALMRKGFCVPLDSSEIIADSVASMYPAIQKAVTYDGKICALPLSVTWRELAYNSNAFAASGLPVPQSWEDVANLINTWENQPDEIQDEYQIGEYVDLYADWFLLRMTDSYVGYLQTTGQPLAFDTPLYRRLMALQSSLSTYADNNEMMDDLEALLTSGVDVAEIYGYHLVPLQMEGAVVHKGGLYIAIINPYSTHQEAAMSLLNYMAQHRSKPAQIQMSPNNCEPVEMSSYADNVQQWTLEHEQLQTELDTCAPENRRICEEALEKHEEKRAQIEANRYSISPDTINEWHEIMETMIFPEPSVLDLNEDIFSTLMFRYLDGELPLERYILEMERMATMINEEAGN